jgi:hypothetical protein
MTNKNTSVTKNGQSKPSSTPKPATPTPRPAPSQGQTVSKGGKNK